MAETAQTKVCPLCAETIKAAAKVCPYCGAKQGRHVFLRQELMVAVPVIALIVAAVVVIAQFAPDENSSGGRSFEGHQNELIALSSSLESTGTNQDFWITGTVTNQGRYPWRVRELEIRFLDKKGNLLDVFNPNVKDTFVVGAGKEGGFRVELGRLVWMNDEVIRQVRVQLATDGDWPVKSD